MSHSITFYAMNSGEFASRLRESGQVLLDMVEQRIRTATPPGEYDEAGLRDVMAAADSLCQGTLPAECSVEYFYALGWLAEVASERVTIGAFQEFSQLEFLEETGIWPWLLRTRPPFIVPVTSNPPPQVGFLSFADMERGVLASFRQLPLSVVREVRNARADFLDVLESLLADGMDLGAILV